MFGRFSILQTPSTIRAAGIIATAAFFAPLISISPYSGRPPLMTYLTTVSLLLRGKWGPLLPGSYVKGLFALSKTPFQCQTILLQNSKYCKNFVYNLYINCYGRCNYLGLARVWAPLQSLNYFSEMVKYCRIHHICITFGTYTKVPEQCFSPPGHHCSFTPSKVKSELQLPIRQLLNWWNANESNRYSPNHTTSSFSSWRTLNASYSSLVTCSR